MRGFYRAILIIMLALVMPSLCVSADEAGSCGYNSAQSDLDEYMTSLKEKIARVWEMPENNQKGHAEIVFKLNRDGEVVSADITESSGNIIFDQMAIYAVKKSAPFGALPEDSKREYLSIKYSFDSKAVETDKMEKYIAQSEQYYNIDKNISLNYLDKAINETKGESASYFLYARRGKLNKELGNIEESNKDLAECKRLKTIYDKKRIIAAKSALEAEPTALAYFSLANAYDIAGDYQEALINIDKAIDMTPLNQAYKRYKLEIASRADAKK